jgi:hypothetical protein
MDAPNGGRSNPKPRDDNPDETKIRYNETNYLAVSTMWVAKDLNEFSL